MSGEASLDPQQLAEQAGAAMSAEDLASQGLGISLQAISPGTARNTMCVRRDMVNSHGICHGGYIFTLADTAFAYACNSYDRVTVAASATIEFLAMAREGDILTAVAEERAQGNRTGVYDVLVSNREGQQIALFRGRSHRVRGSVTGSANTVERP